MGGKVVDQLPAGHSLTGCDTVAKVGTKLAMIRTLTSQGEDSIINFGKESIITAAEHFVVQVAAKKSCQGCETFNELRLKEYFQSHKKRFIDLPCSSVEMQENIKRANMQTGMQLNIWIQLTLGIP